MATNDHTDVSDKTPSTALDSARTAVAHAYAALEARMPGFIARRAQRQMSDAIVERFVDDSASSLLAIEGQTGTGKTLAYLIGGVAAAKATRSQLVIATATTALQAQLLEREIPITRRYAGIAFDAAVAKGRGRYADPGRVDQLLGRRRAQTDLLGGGGSTAAWRRPPTDREQRQLAELAERLDREDWDGCKDSLEEAINPELWSMIASTSHTCPSESHCKAHGYCPFHRARRALSGVAVIVANHDLVLSDINLGGGVILPEPDQTFYVVDEAHHLAEKAVEHGAAAATLGDIHNTAGEFLRLCGTLPRGIDAPASLDKRVHELERNLSALSAVLSGLPAEPNRDQIPIYRAPSGDLPEPVCEAAGWLKADLAGLGEMASTLAQALDAHYERTSDDKALALRSAAGEITDQLTTQFRLAELFSTHTPPEQPPIARWVEQRHDVYFLAAAPVTAAPMLEAKLWHACKGALLTSATLTSSDGWTRFRAKTGLANHPEARYEKLLSPFDYPQAATLHVPSMRTDGSKGIEHTYELAEIIPRLIRDNPVATLVLFTSWTQLRTVRAQLPGDLAARWRFQGDATRDALLDAHRRSVTRGQAPVLCGLASFAEGVDLQGPACEHVIICKAPFTPPDEPIEATRAEWLKRRGRSPFATMSIPEASLKLCQAAGRLMRSETDKGRVTILDRRVVTKGYGRQLLDALPPFRRVVD